MTKDFREFVFHATGKDTKLAPLSMLDLIDNLNAELERLHAITELLDRADDEVDHRTLSGTSSLLADIEARIRAILDHAPR